MIRHFKSASLHIPYKINSRKYTGNDVWIGERVLIMDGIKISDGAVVAARTIGVTR